MVAKVLNSIIDLNFDAASLAVAYKFGKPRSFDLFMGSFTRPVKSGHLCSFPKF